jgi:hypothetical protein
MCISQDKLGSAAATTIPKSEGHTTKCVSSLQPVHGLGKANCILCHWPLLGPRLREKEW